MSDSENRGRSIVESSAVAALFGGTGIAGTLYGARTWMPELASRHGAGIDAMLHYLLVTVGSLFLVGYVVLAYFIWTGARRREIGPRFASRRTELVLSAALGLGMALIAEGGVLAIGIPVWQEYFDAALPEASVLGDLPSVTDVEVTAQQFMWNVRYPGPDGRLGRTNPTFIDDATNPVGIDRSDPASKDDVFTQNDITVPSGRPVRIRLHSRDVIHSFFLPHFRVKQDAVPGMSPDVVFFPTRPGRYEIACAELCGLAHYRMQGYFNVVSEQEYRQWQVEQMAGGH